MDRTVEYRGIAKVFWSGRSQAVRLPAPCRFDCVRGRGDQGRQFPDAAAARQELGRVLRFPHARILTGPT